MLVYFVYDRKKDSDVMVLPEMGCSVPVDVEGLETFISVNPDFSKWSGDSCKGMTPENFGTIVAIRDDCGDVSVRNSKLWQERMSIYLGDQNEQ
jgi:hypothetical protein